MTGNDSKPVIFKSVDCFV